MPSVNVNVATKLLECQLILDAVEWRIVDVFQGQENRH